MELISRDEVMRLAESGKLLSGSFGERAKDIIKAIPTVEERKEGRWIKHIDDLFPADSTIECSICHEEQYLMNDNNFCPNCGAKMKGSE